VLGIGRASRCHPDQPGAGHRRIASQPKRPPRALTSDEREAWITLLAAGEDAVRKDLPDLCEWMLATGVRIGEALAVSWEEVDLKTGMVCIDYTLIRIKESADPEEHQEQRR